MGIDRSRRIAFEETANIYNDTRPGYPEQLVEDVISLSNVPVNGRILEIGCGSGNATVAFARHDYEVLAVELGTRLTSYAKQNCKKYKKVTVLNMAFEDWPTETKAFDLAISADAFHWIVPEIGYPKVAAALKPGSSLAFFWNVNCNSDSSLSQAIRVVYKELAPQAEDPNGSFTQEYLIETVSQVINSTGLFGSITIKLNNSIDTLTSENYARSLWTFSSHHSLDPQIRTELYRGIRKAIDNHGGTIAQERKIVLFHAFVK